MSKKKKNKIKELVNKPYTKTIQFDLHVTFDNN